MADTVDAKEVLKIVERVRPILANKDPNLIGATLCELVSMFIAGHSPFAREELLRMHMEFVQQLIPINEHHLFGDAGHPDKRTKQEAGGDDDGSRVAQLHPRPAHS